MNSKDKHMNIHDEVISKNKKRGEILYYSVSQVAALLGEEDSNVRYYTNVFDNILKIEIENKELRYTLKDIDKLEFLINLKNKGMTVKQIQKYCEELPLDNEDSKDIKEIDSISFEEIITSITNSENKQIDNLNENLTNKIDESYKLAIQKINDNNKLVIKTIDENNTLAVQKIAELIIDNQNKQLTHFKDDILKEIKEYVNNKLDTEYKTNNDLYNKFSDIDTLLSEKLLLQDNVKSQLNKLNELCICRDKNLLEEIRKSRRVLEQAYYVQQEVDTQKKGIGFIQKLFGYR